MAIADTIVIMKDGVIEDAGPPQDVYSHPRSRFSAQFMGESNILDADISEGMAETALGRFPVVGKGTAAVAIRPENFTVTPGEGAVSLGMAALEEVVFQGSFVRLSARIGNVEIRLRVPPADISGSGQQVEVFLKRGGAAALQS